MTRAESIAFPELDELYALPPSAFTAARDKLAQRLKKEGDRERAAQVKSLAKPSVPLWVVNQLARTAPREIRALLEAGEALREAQADVVSGRGSGALKAGMQTRRDAVSTLVVAARGVLAEAGLPATAATLERVAEMLSTIATMPDPPALGRLSQDVVQEDLDLTLLLGGGAVPRAPPKTPAPPVAIETAPPAPKPSAEPRIDVEAAARAARLAKAEEERDRALAIVREQREKAKRAGVASERAVKEFAAAKQATTDAASRARQAHDAWERARREADARAREAETKQEDATRMAELEKHAETSAAEALRVLGAMEEDLVRAEKELAVKELEVLSAPKG